MKSRRKAAKKRTKKTRRAPRKAAKKRAKRKGASTKKRGGKKKGTKRPKKSKLPPHSEPHAIIIKNSLATPSKSRVSSQKPCKVQWDSEDVAYTLAFSTWPFEGRKHKVEVPAMGSSETLTVRKNAPGGGHGYRIDPRSKRSGKKPDPEIVVDE